MPTGQTPFAVGHDLQVMFAHCNNPVPDPRQRSSDIPTGCAEVVFKAMAKNPAERYQTMIALLEALVVVLNADGIDTPTDPSGEHAALDLPPDDTLATTVVSPRSAPVSARPSRRKLLLALPAAERPHYIAVYMNGPDTAEHFDGIDSPETAAAVVESDALLGRLMAAVDAHPDRERIALVADYDGVKRWIVLRDPADVQPRELAGGDTALKDRPRVFGGRQKRGSRHWRPVLSEWTACRRNDSEYFYGSGQQWNRP